LVDVVPVRVCIIWETKLHTLFNNIVSTEILCELESFSLYW